MSLKEHLSQVHAVNKELGFAKGWYLAYASRHMAHMAYLGVPMPCKPTGFGFLFLLAVWLRHWLNTQFVHFTVKTWEHLALTYLKKFPCRDWLFCRDMILLIPSSQKKQVVVWFGQHKHSQSHIESQGYLFATAMIMRKEEIQQYLLAPSHTKLGWTINVPQNNHISWECLSVKWVKQCPRIPLPVFLK